MYHNIEKSGFHKGQYVGYADGAWRIMRNGIGTWSAYKREGIGYYQAHTLREISRRLDAYLEWAAVAKMM